MFSETARLYDAIYSFKDYAHDADRVHDILIEKGKPGGTLLDVACGTGKHMKELASYYEVEGLDLDEGLLEVARERCPYAPFHVGDMRSFDLGKRFDVVLCLFSSIGYVKTLEGLQQAIATMAKHLKPDGVLVVEPWLYPDAYNVGHLHSLYIEEPELRITRMSISGREDDVSVLDIKYLVGTPQGIDYLEERHELGLFTPEQYEAALRNVGLEVDYDPIGLMNRGLFIGTPAQESTSLKSVE